MWQIMVLSVICLTTSCFYRFFSEPGSGGEMYPQVGDGYTVVKTFDDWEAVRVDFGKASVRIGGSWTQGGVSTAFKIENDSDEPFAIDFAQVKMEVLPEEVGLRLTKIYDDSSSAYKPDGETYNEDSKLVYDLFGEEYKGETKPVGDTKVSCPPKKKCIFSLQNYRVIDYPKMEKSKSLRITLPPTADKTEATKVIFNFGAKSLLDSLTAKK